MTEHCLILTTCPDDETADTLAATLLKRRLAACVTALPGGRSLYEWQGRVEHEKEVVLLIKSREEAYPALEATLREHHPYELPEIVKVPITGGLAPYLAWIDNSVDTSA